MTKSEFDNVARGAITFAKSKLGANFDERAELNKIRHAIYDGARLRILNELNLTDDNCNDERYDRAEDELSNMIDSLTDDELRRLAQSV